jgi:hypothetical protein
MRRPPFVAAGVLALTALLVGCKEATFGPETFGSIQGRVLDFETGATLANAVISTSPPSSSLVTNESGEFTVESVAAGNYTITASRNGYQSGAVTVAVQQNRTTQAVLFLRPEEEEDSTGGGGTDDTFEVTVLSFQNIPGSTSDSASVRVEYRVRNLGEAAIPNYEVYFRIFTNGPTFFQEQRGTSLGPGQQDIVQFDKRLLGFTASDVVVDDFWYTGQPRDRDGRLVAARTP